MRKQLLIVCLVVGITIADVSSSLCTTKFPFFGKKCETPITEAINDFKNIGGSKVDRIAEAIGKTGRIIEPIKMPTINLDLDNILVNGIHKFNPFVLNDFLREQIDYFINKTLYMLDDSGKEFKLKLELPDINLFNILPNLDEKVTFSLYDKTHGSKSFDILKVNDPMALAKSRFNSSRPTVFITHGYVSSAYGPSVALIRDAYLKTHDYNVITVNWSPLSVGSYCIARFRVIEVGKHVGNLINFLYNYGMSPDSTTLIGHSLGSHIMGFAAQTAVHKVNHIIGLDPAWPLFVGLPNSQRLSHDDAQHVEIMHTNAGLLGIPEAIGDFDFYPNGGTLQDGCEGLLYTACSHCRAYAYLAEQIERGGKSFGAVQCGSYDDFLQRKCLKGKDTSIMGAVNMAIAKKGAYFLRTSGKKPFALGLFS